MRLPVFVLFSLCFIVHSHAQSIADKYLAETADDTENISKERPRDLAKDLAVPHSGTHPQLPSQDHPSKEKMEAEIGNDVDAFELEPYSEVQLWLSSGGKIPYVLLYTPRPTSKRPQDR